MPIAHLYKTQVYQLAEYLGVEEEIRRRPPTTDTFSHAAEPGGVLFRAALSSDGSVPLRARTTAISADDVAAVVGLTAAQVQRVFKDIDAKRRATRYLHARLCCRSSVRGLTGMCGSPASWR